MSEDEIKNPTVAAGAGSGNEQEKGKNTGLVWVEQHQSLAIGMAFALVLFYVAPVFIIALVAWQTGGFQEDSFWFSWFAAFMKSADSTLNQFHKILLPFMTTISVIAFRGRPTRGMLLLGGFILLAFVVAVFVDVVFSMKGTLTALKGLEDPIDIQLVKVFFTRIQESLMMYLMMLVGINIVNANK